jgi:hypothetical protein
MRDRAAAMSFRRVPRVIVLLLLIGALLVLVWSGQRKLLYFPFGAVPQPAEVALPGAETVAFDTDDGLTLHAWFVPAASPSMRLTVIVFNGNGGNRALRAPLAARLADEGIATLLVDYRGYGGNPGSPSEEGLARDARAARRYVAARTDVDPARIVYFGESLGSGVAVQLALDERPFALILRSPYTSIVDMAAHHYPFLPARWLLRDRFPSLDRIPRVVCPLLVIAARHDTIVPSDQSERLYAAATSRKRFLMIEDADHNDYELLAGPRVIETIVEFLRGGDQVRSPV